MAERLVDLAELDALTDDLESLASALHNERLLTRLGLAQIRRIKKRTRAGVDVHGNPFAEYSDGYARLRTAAGVPRKRDMLMYGVRVVDGEAEANAYDTMLDHLHETVADDLQSVELDFDRDDKAELAGYHNEGEGHNPKREFSAVNDGDLDALAELVDADVLRTLRLSDLS